MAHRFKLNKGEWKPGQSREIKIRRGGKVNTDNSGPAGWKLSSAARHYRALADMAAARGVVGGKRKTAKP